MPVCGVHLLSLATSTQDFLKVLSTTNVETLVVSRVIRWIITPEILSLDPVLSKDARWDLLLILPNDTPLPASLQTHLRAQWSVKAGIPSGIVSGFAERNRRLLAPRKGDVPSLTGSLDTPLTADSSQELTLSPQLFDWAKDFSRREGAGAVSMLNLLAFVPGKKSEYLKYGQEFAKSVGSRRGGNAKIVGTVLEDGSGKGVGVGEKGKVWDEVALAHYPSILHFVDMLASQDYQEVNKRHRVGSLKDTFILCTTELDLPQDSAFSSKL